MRTAFRDVLFALIMVALLAGAWYFVFKKATDRIARLRDDTRNKQAQLDQVEKALREIRDVQQEMADLKRKADVFDSKLPSASDVQVILAQVTGFGTKNRVNIKTVRTLRTEKMGNYMEDQMGLTILGDFRQVYQFLLDIERMDRITRINKLEIRRLEPEGVVSVELGLSIFYVPDSTAMVN